MRADIIIGIALAVVFEAAAVSVYRDVERPSLVAGPPVSNPTLPAPADVIAYGDLQAAR